jgi:hypothetical protein
MSESFVFFDTNTKLCTHIVTSSSLDAYEDGKIYGSEIAVDSEHFPNIDFQVISNTYHWMGEGILIGTHLPRDNPLYIWDPLLLTYKEPDGYFEMMISKMASEVNIVARDTIFKVYPIFRQLYIGRDPTTSEAITMYSFIDNIRNLSNISQAEILQAITLDAVQIALDDFILTMSLI